jgi:hypothetical protein
MGRVRQTPIASAIGGFIGCGMVPSRKECFFEEALR